MKKKLSRSLLYITFFLCCIQSVAQHTDSLSVAEEQEGGSTKFIFSFDNRRSFVFDQPVKFSGLRIGLEVNKKHDFGLGFYGTTRPVRRLLRDVPIEIEAEFNYTTLFYEYAFYQNHKWEFSVPMHLGTGKADLSLFHEGTNDYLRDEKGIPIMARGLPFAISEIGISAQYKVFPWFGIGTGTGYRFVLSTDNNAKDLFNAPIYYFKFKIFIGELYRSVKRAVKGENDESGD